MILCTLFEQSRAWLVRWLSLLRAKRRQKALPGFDLAVFGTSEQIIYPPTHGERLALADQMLFCRPVHNGPLAELLSYFFAPVLSPNRELFSRFPGAQACVSAPDSHQRAQKVADFRESIRPRRAVRFLFPPAMFLQFIRENRASGEFSSGWQSCGNYN